MGNHRAVSELSSSGFAESIDAAGIKMRLGIMNTSSRSVSVVATVVFFLSGTGCDNPVARREIERAEAQVRRIAADLDKMTTEKGVYVRVKEDEIKENDPWGTQVQVSYSQGGVAEVVSVRSAGPDRQFHSDDDVVAQGMAANFKGVGEGIKDNAEETASNAAKGAVKGAVEGVKESVKEALPFKKKKADTSNSKTEEAPQNTQPEPDKPGV